VRESELSVDEVRAAVADPAAGGIALFAGTVRDTDHDQGVTGLSSCPHRTEAFDACRDLIDILKASVPIWKHQRFDDGTAEWVGSP